MFGAESGHRRFRVALVAGWICLAGSVQAGSQQYEPLAASVQAALHAAVSDHASPEPLFPSEQEKANWLGTMSGKLARYVDDASVRLELLKTVHYEATRAGLDPQLVLSVIQVESAFRKYAVSKASARGYMQVMPFWAKLIGDGDDNLFHVRTNLRYGCTILRHYLDIEKGNLFRALGRYNGSLGKAHYPNLVLRAWRRNWTLEGESVAQSDSP
ncbi:MAG: lytic transglycosylase domain-containing protein [Rhodocyclaceae bacterium]|nr:lytic transglycosylase domain-containing protein [Rhodocyclaceae bacterium]